MESAFVRARKPEQIEQRRAHLLDTARRLLTSGVALNDLGLNQLARSAGVSKANVYRYFGSREAVFLSLLWDETGRWWRRLAPRLESPNQQTRTLDGLVTVFAESVAREPLLCELTAAVPSVLEANLSEEAIATFKRQMLEFFAEAADTLARCCPDLPAAGYAQMLYDTTTAVVGLYPSTHPSAAAARAQSAEDLEFFRRDFGSELERFLRALAADHARRSPGIESLRSRSGDRAGNRGPR